MQEALNTLVLALIYLIFSLGLSLAWGTVGILNFAHGAIFMFTVFLDYTILKHTQLPIVVMLVLGAAMGAVLSLAIHVVGFEPIVRRATNLQAVELQILIAGIGLADVLLAVAQKQTQSFPFGLTASSFHTHTYQAGSVRISNIQIIIIAVGLVLAAGIAIWVQRSRVGLALRATGIDAEAAAMMGIGRRRLTYATMSLAGALAGIAGVLLTYYFGSIQASTGDSLMLKAFAAIVLGGVGSTAGAAVGALVLAAAETYVVSQTSGTWVDAISFGLLFVVLLLRPQGIFGRKTVVRT